LRYKTKGFRKEVSLIVVSKLFPSNREWRTRNSPCQKVNTTKIRAIDFEDRLFDCFPLGSVLAKSVTSMMVNLDGRGKVEASCFDASCLASCPRADLKDC
jgi:hypothetical protein